VSISTLKRYLRLLLENELENQNQNLIEESDAIALLRSSLKGPISEIIKVISEKNLFDFIDYQPLAAVGAKSGTFVVLQRIADMGFLASDYLPLLVTNITYSLKRIEQNDQIFFSREELDENLNDYLSICSDSMETLHLLDKKIKEDEASSFSETSKQNAPLGKVVFPSLRSGVPLEKNTAVETTLQRAIYEHIVNNKSLKGKDAQIIKTLVSGNFYPKWFGEPSARTVYRGMHVPKSYIAKILKGDPDKDQVGTRGEVLLSWEFEPLNETSSWTLDQETAVRSFTGGMGGDGFGFLMTAKVSHNSGKFVDLSRLYGIEGFSGFSSEQEVIGVGNIKVTKIKWWS
jgi:hypothetical protein